MRELGTSIADTLHQILSTGTGPDIIPMPTPVVIVPRLGLTASVWGSATRSGDR